MFWYSILISIVILLIPSHLSIFGLQFVGAENHDPRRVPVPVSVCEAENLSKCAVYPQKTTSRGPISSTYQTLTRQTTIDPRIFTTTKSPKTPLEVVSVRWRDSLSNPKSGQMSTHKALPPISKQINAKGELFCSFAEELYSSLSHSVCDPPHWQIWNSQETKRRKREVTGQRVPLTSEEEAKLRKNYGNKFDKEVLERLKAIGIEEEYWELNPEEGDLEEEECSLYGTWVSSLGGVSMKLEPFDSSISITLQDLSRSRGFLSSLWVGKVTLSPLSPTTVTLAFQEGDSNMMEDSPDTAVFVGQCVPCQGGSVIQGTWTIFPKRYSDCSFSHHPQM